MKIEFVRESEAFNKNKPFVIFINEFTDEERNDILETVRPHNATVMYGQNLIMITCKDEATFNWLALKWQ